MEDYSFGGTEEENAELKKLKAEVVCEVFFLRIRSIYALF